MAGPDDSSAAPIPPFAMLPREALALVADRLETPDRLCFSGSCVAAAGAVALSTKALALPGGLVLAMAAAASCRDQHGAQDGEACSELEDTAAAAEAQAEAEDHLACSGVAPPLRTVPLLRSHLGLRALAVTACGDCAAARAANAPAAAAAAAGAATRSHVPALAACLAELRSDCPCLRHLVLRSICACVVAAKQPVAEQGGVLETIAASCPNLVTLSMPGWLLLAPRDGDSSSSHEEFASLARLTGLRALGINCANALPLSAVEQLSRLSKLQSLSIAGVAAGGALAAPAPWQQQHMPLSSSSGGSVSTALAASLAQLPALTHLVLAGVPGTAHVILGLTRLTSLALSHLDADFTMASLVRVAALTRLTRLSIRGCPALEAPLRVAFPAQLQELQQLQQLVLDCELHLRDVQVLCRLGQLTHLTAAGFHHCVHMVGGLSLPSLKRLTVAMLHQMPGQQEQLPPAQVVPAAAAPPPAGLMQPPVPAPAAAAGVSPAAAVSGAAAGPQQQQQPMLLPVASTVPLHAALQMLVLLPPPQLQPMLAPAAAAVTIRQQQAQQHWQLQQWQLQQFQLQQMQLHLGQLQHQLDTGAKDAAQKQQQQRRSHGRQKMNRTGQQQPAAPRSPSHSILQMAAAAGRSTASGQQQLQQLQQQQEAQQQMLSMLAAGMPLPAAPALYAPLPVAAPTGQHMQQQVLGVMPPPPEPVEAAAAVAAPAVPPQAAGACPAQQLGWLVALCPALTQLELRSARGMQNAFVAVQGHPVLQTLVLGSSADAAQRASVGAAAAESQPRGGGEVVPAAMAAWGMLASLPSLTALEVHNTGAVLPGSVMPLALLARQLTRLVLREAASMSDAAAAALLGTGHWTRLRHLEVHGALELSNGGLGYASKVPGLTHLAFSHCPRISAPGLASLMLLSVDLRSVRLLCCAGITPDEAQAAADAVWAVGRRRVQVTWSRHDTAGGKRRIMV